jgi:hypothetical protein
MRQIEDFYCGECEVELFWWFDDFSPVGRY